MHESLVNLASKGQGLVGGWLHPQIEESGWHRGRETGDTRRMLLVLQGIKGFMVVMVIGGLLCVRL